MALPRKLKLMSFFATLNNSVVTSWLSYFGIQKIRGLTPQTAADTRNAFKPV